MHAPCAHLHQLHIGPQLLLLHDVRRGQPRRQAAQQAAQQVGRRRWGRRSGRGRSCCRLLLRMRCPCRLLLFIVVVLLSRGMPQRLYNALLQLLHHVPHQLRNAQRCQPRRAATGRRGGGRLRLGGSAPGRRRPLPRLPHALPCVP